MVTPLIHTAVPDITAVPLRHLDTPADRRHDRPDTNVSGFNSSI